MSHYFDTACPLVAWYDQTVAAANAVLQAAELPGLTSEEREKLREAFLAFYVVRTEISHRIGAEKAWLDYHVALTPLKRGNAVVRSRAGSH
jgi:hypothetical protein